MNAPQQWLQLSVHLSGLRGGQIPFDFLCTVSNPAMPKIVYYFQKLLERRKRKRRKLTTCEEKGWNLNI